MKEENLNKQKRIMYFFVDFDISQQRYLSRWGTANLEGKELEKLDVLSVKIQTMISKFQDSLKQPEE